MSDEEETETDEVLETVARIEESVSLLTSVVMFGILCAMGLLLGSLIAWIITQVGS